MLNNDDNTIRNSPMKKAIIVTFRVTLDEHSRLIGLLRSSGVSLSQFIRSRILG